MGVRRGRDVSQTYCGGPGLWRASVSGPHTAGGLNGQMVRLVVV